MCAYTYVVSSLEICTCTAYAYSSTSTTVLQNRLLYVQHTGQPGSYDTLYVYTRSR